MSTATPEFSPDGPFPLHRPVELSEDAPVADLAAGFQEAVVEVLAVKTARAALAHDVKTVILAGGVAANAALRDRLVSEVAKPAAPMCRCATHRWPCAPTTRRWWPELPTSRCNPAIRPAGRLTSTRDSAWENVRSQSDRMRGATAPAFDPTTVWALTARSVCHEES